MNGKFIRIEELSLALQQEEGFLASLISSLFDCQVKDGDWKIVKRAIDSRNKSAIKLVYSVDVKVAEPEAALAKIAPDKIVRHRIRVVEPFKYEIKRINNFSGLPVVAEDDNMKRIVVVGGGPAGLFAALVLARAGLRPLIIERGKPVEERAKDVERFFATGALDPESNVQFGEGGAGTFSDGKLYTLINDPRSQFVFEELVKAGAPAEILIDAHPHIGTDKLRTVVQNLRAEIIRCGGEFRFEACLTDFEITDNKLSAISIGEERMGVSELVLAVGHSARDTYEMLYESGVPMESKPFAIGVRIEHPRELIDRSQYGGFAGHPRLGPARYKLVSHPADKSMERSVYTFCMCPGGYVVAGASEAGGVVTNGMSEYGRDGANSNSALLVGVLPADFSTDHPLAGVEFQRVWERQAYSANNNYSATAQLVGDFLSDQPSTGPRSVLPTYRPSVRWGRIDDVLPGFIVRSLRSALTELGQKIRGFDHPDAVLTAPETRSSSPVRILRGEDGQSSIRGLYPAGEGSGYAGGITSSAIDGLKAAEHIIRKYTPSP